MIVPLEKVTLLVPVADRLRAVEKLGQLGVMHVASVSLAENSNRSELESKLAETVRFGGILELLRDKHVAHSDCRLAGEELFAAVRAGLSRQTVLQRELEQLHVWAAELKPWGDFDIKSVRNLRERGLFVYLCTGTEQERIRLAGLGFVCREVDKNPRRESRFAAMRDRAAEPEEAMPEVRFSTEMSLSEVIRRIAEVDTALSAANAELRKFAEKLDELHIMRDALTAELDFATVRDSMAEAGIVTTLTGFVPDRAMGELSQAAAENGWGLYYRKADPKKEAVPTLLKQPKWSRVINPLMSFLSISPGYDEHDVSIPVLVFFTIFFGMLVGDAGYGAIFLAVSAVLLYIKRGNRKARLPLLLMCVLSTAAIVWGVMTANYFGLELLPGIDALTSGPNKHRNVQLVCFSLALLQLSFARVWRIVDGIDNWREVLTHLGWMLILCGNFMLVLELLLFTGRMPLPVIYCCYGIGIGLAAAGEIDWTDVGSVFGFPFSVVSSFVDVLSYIRLFAVGLAGYYLAVCFNNMARPMFEKPSTIIIGLLILLFGHILNIALAAMSVLVHGVRLNTLEFSSHLGLRWAGFVFKPFVRNNDTIIAENKGEKQ